MITPRRRRTREVAVGRRTFPQFFGRGAVPGNLDPEAQ